jgi:hypothetical protein
MFAVSAGHAHLCPYLSWCVNYVFVSLTEPCNAAAAGIVIP